MIIFESVTQLPWWFFIIPVMIFGIFAYKRLGQVPYFLLGFISGFIVWSVYSYGIEFFYGNQVLSKVAGILTIPRFLVIIGSGIIGGIITGLAFYSGKNFKKEKNIEFNKINTN